MEWAYSRPIGCAERTDSSLRNKLVAEGFYLINAIEKYGSGFLRIRKALADYPEVRFSIEEAQGGVWAVFEAPSLAVVGEGVKVESQPESQPESQAARVLLLLAQGALSKQQIATALGQKVVSRPLNQTMRQLLLVGKIELTLPDKPNSRLQKYQLSPFGGSQ